MKRDLLVLFALAGWALALPHFASEFVVSMALTCLMYATLASSWGTFCGSTRYLSLATAAFFGIGAYTGALVLDRLPPTAELSLGLSYTPTPRLTLRATAYNALVGHYYQADPFFDYEPHLEYLPNPYEGFRAYLSALYHY